MNIKERLQQSIHNHKYFIFMFGFFIFVYIYTSLSTPTEKPKENLLSVDTLIPKNYALVPIELKNIEAIASLIEGYGVVDIYEGNKKIFHRVKILRAPNNPNTYSLLVPDRLSAVLLKHRGPFFAVVQKKSDAAENPEVSETARPQIKNVKIEYNGG